MYSEHVFKNAVSAVKRPAGFLKDWLAFIFDKNSGTQICDSNLIISASLKCKTKDYMRGTNWCWEFTVLSLSFTTKNHFIQFQSDGPLGDQG